MLTSFEKEMLARLQKRADHLTDRLVQAKAMGKSLSYDAAERAALLFAIKRIEGGAA